MFMYTLQTGQGGITDVLILCTDTPSGRPGECQEVLQCIGNSRPCGSPGFKWARSKNNLKHVEAHGTGCFKVAQYSGGRGTRKHVNTNGISEKLQFAIKHFRAC